MRGLRAATSFLTRVPVGWDVRGPHDIARGVPWFPVVGAVLGLAVAGVYGAGRLVFPSLVAAALAVAFAVWLTGAFHEDGLADSADAFGGASSPPETLRILKDPRLGTYGVAALVLALLVRVAAVGALDGRVALVVLPAAHAMSRAGAIALLRGPVATEAGIGSSYAAAATGLHVALALGAGVVVGAVTLGLWVVPAAVGVGVASATVGRLAHRRIGGVTGDVMGAAQQAGEVVVLLLGAAVIRDGWPPAGVL